MKTMKELVSLTQDKLKEFLPSKLKESGYKNITKSDKYIYAEGSVPVLLVAHLDTVHKDPVKDICVSENEEFIMSPQGIGGDDRCGVYMILNIINDFKCHVLFTTDEEIGCIGAKEFAKSNIVPDVNYIVELDRKDANDCVFYDCNNPEFTSFVESFGFKKAEGSYTDICHIAPKLKTAAVNLSCGYFNPHQKSEYIDMFIVKRNILMVKNMLKKTDKKFEYIEVKRAATDYSKYSWYKSYYSTNNEPDVMKRDLFVLKGKDIIVSDYLGNYISESVYSWFGLDKFGTTYFSLDGKNFKKRMGYFFTWKKNRKVVHFKENKAREVSIKEW